MKNIECPCCEVKSTSNQWYEISNDNFLVCPVCDNTCEYKEFEEGVFLKG